MPPGGAWPGFPPGLRSGPAPPPFPVRSPSLPPCHHGAPAPGMPRAADSLINSLLCGRLARTGRARTGPCVHPHPSPRSVCARVCACARALGRGRPCREWGSYTHLGELCVCVCRGLLRLRVAVFVSQLVICKYLPGGIPQALH